MAEAEAVPASAQTNNEAVASVMQTSGDAGPSSMQAPDETTPLQESESVDSGEASATTKKKKRSKGKSVAQRGPTALPRNRGTGLEEYYADPPMTPVEAWEEKYDIYHEDFPFEERILSCIQRFRSRRRLRGKLTLYFDEYLFLGGIDTSAKCFGGQDPHDLKDMPPAECCALLATDMIHGGSAVGDRFYAGDREHWSIDFTGVAAGFFSITLANLTGLEKEPLESAINLVQNFLRYALQHDVCPEYEEDIQRAIKLCDTARDEWPMVVRLRNALPGQFNLAAAEYFGQREESDWFLQNASIPENFDAKSVFLSTFGLVAEDDLFTRVITQKANTIRQFDCDLQIKQIIKPSDSNIQLFKSLRLDDGYVTFPCVGNVICTPAIIEDGWDHPVVPLPLENNEQITLYFDDVIVANMKEGMKMAVTLCEVNEGLLFVKTIRNIVPSFYTFPPQELIRHFKAPKEDDRPAPSIHDARKDDDYDGSVEE